MSSPASRGASPGGVEPTSARRLAVQLGSLVVLVVLLFVLPVLAGVLAAVILLLGWAPVVVDLLKALRPLALPLVAVAVLGSALGDLSLGAQLLVGLLAALIAIPWGAASWARSTEEVGKSTRRLLRRSWRALLVALLLVAVALVALAFVPAVRRWIGGSVETFDELGGVPIALALASVLVWAIALVLRTVAFTRARSRAWGRAMFAFLLLVLAARGLMDAGLFPSLLGFVPIELLAAVTGVVLVVVLAAELIVASAVGSDSTSPLARIHAAASWLDGRELGVRRTDGLLARGLGFSIASAFVLLVALLWGVVEVNSGSDEIGAGSRAALPARRPAAMSDAQLARTFAPVLQLSARERWRPQRVDAYVSDTPLNRRPPADASLAGGLPTACEPDRVDPCYHLDCPSATDPCAHVDGSPDRSGLSRDGTAYVRVARLDTADARRSPAFDVRVPPYRRQLAILVQYWLFYPYDEWEAPVLGGRLVQRHAGDWEAVTVGLSADQPLFVAYSQHCGGRWTPWDRTLVADAPRLRTHPLVAVALGSHANYANAKDVRTPIWTSCSHIPDIGIDLLGFAWNIRDRTASDWEVLPGDLVQVTAKDPPMTFPGTWGASDSTQFVGFHATSLGQGGGPRTPTRQPLWYDAVRQIFCSPDWKQTNLQGTRVRCPPPHG